MFTYARFSHQEGEKTASQLALHVLHHFTLFFQIFGFCDFLFPIIFRLILTVQNAIH